MKKLIHLLEYIHGFGGIKRDIIFLVISGIALFESMFHFLNLPFDFAWIAIILCGTPIIMEAVIGIISEFDIKADLLVSLALIASLLIGENFAAGEVAFIMQLGALLEEITVAKARAGLEKLIRLTPQTARVLRNDTENIIPVEQVQLNDHLRILPGETIPVDGIITSGQTAINQAIMTGESLPIDKGKGDEVFSGTINQFNTFEMEAKKVGEDSAIQRMIRLVQSVDTEKAKIVRIADRWATWIVIIALTAAILTWFVTGEIIRAVTILVVFCPCALVLATPTAIMAAIGNATKHNFLIREGDALERLSIVKKIAFDKTGTLTFGTPEIIAIKPNGDRFTSENLLLYAATAESLSEHPLGKAIVRHYKKQFSNKMMEVERFERIPSQGIRTFINTEQVLIGNLSLLSTYHITLPKTLQTSIQPYSEKGAIIIYLAIDNTFAGFIALSDTVRPASLATIDALKSSNYQPVLLTGDSQPVAKTIADQLGIYEFHAACLPEDKLNHIDQYQTQHHPVCMIGDGINDAPALKKAFVGIAMGKIGSDIAVDAADIVLVNDKVEELPHLLKLSQRMMKTIKLNMASSMTLNFIAIILACIGILNPIGGALLHNAGSIAVILNSALLLRWSAKN